MDRYFEDMLPAEELEQLKFIPTIPEFVTWIEQKWYDLPALSDTVSICTYAKMCNDIAHKRALLNSLGLEKGDKVAILDNTTPEAVIGSCLKFNVKVLEGSSHITDMPTCCR